MKEWCLGFIFTPDQNAVVLLKKSRTMHVDRWNGIGGKIEDNESALGSMIRECKEEIGLDITRWEHVGYLRGGHDANPWRVFVYAAVDSGIKHEMTAEWEANATKDTPFRVPLNEVQYLRTAPHTMALIHASLEKLRFPSTSIMEFKELEA